MANVLHFDQDHVLDQCLETFWKKGYKAATTRELADTAGISESSLFNTFSSKREIYLAALRRYSERSRQRGEQLLNAESSLQGLRNYWEQMAKLAADPARTRGCMITNATVELTDDPEIVAYLKSVHRGYEKNFRKALDRAVQQGELRADTDTRALSEYLAHCAQGMRLLSRINPGRRKVRSIVDTVLGTIDQFRP